MSAGVTGSALERVLEREGAATEGRQWVRLTRRCNNRCAFCHDVGQHDGTVATVEEVLRVFRAGRERGATRLVLSGGEPTIHPRLLDLVKMGRDAGYRWVQVVSNGRMFAYERFVAAAAAAGIDEVTLSIHGHTPELHDGLVGAAGAFVQTIRGLRNLQRAGLVTSVDVVVCRPNVRHLPEIVGFLLELGVREFDLLHLVPFGRAFEDERALLELDPAEARPDALEAFALAERAGAHVWTNRWPAPLLEGAEHLIQDPHKILDEVRGRLDEFRAHVETGERVHCAGERCRRCFLEEFCRTLTDARARLAEGRFEVIALDADAASGLSDGVRAAMEAQGGARLRLRAPDAETASRALPQCPRAGTAELELDLLRLSPLPAALARRARRVVLRRDEDVGTALALDVAEIEVPLGRATAALARRALEAAGDRVILRTPGRSLLSEALTADLPPLDAAALAGSARAEGIARCIARRAERLPPVLDADVLGPRGKLDLLAWADRWVRDAYRTKSLRCRECLDAPACDGAHVNVVRAHGFGWMRPTSPAGQV
jgi:pyruvate-formate lyase-activating enzyme